MEKKGYVPLDNHCLGQIAERDVCSHDGTLLVRKGAVVTKAALDLLTHWGVTHLWVSTPKESPEEVFQAGIQEVAKLYLDIRSGKNLDQPNVYQTVNRMVEAVLEEGGTFFR